jgi:hypothetical protein
MSVTAGSRPPHLTDSHGHRPHNPPDLARPEHRPSSGTQPRAATGPAPRPVPASSQMASVPGQRSRRGQPSPVSGRRPFDAAPRSRAGGPRSLRPYRGVTPGHEHQPAEHPDHGQVDETDEDERRAYSTRSWQAQGFGNANSAGSHRSGGHARRVTTIGSSFGTSLVAGVAPAVCVCTGGTGFRHPQLEPRTVRIVSIYERGPDGRLAAVRVYDDVEAPVGHRSGSVFWSCTPTARATPSTRSSGTPRRSCTATVRLTRRGMRATRPRGRDGIRGGGSRRARSRLARRASRTPRSSQSWSSACWPRRDLPRN